MTRERIEDTMTSEEVDIGAVCALGTGEIVEVEVVVTRLDGTVDRYICLTERR